MRCRGTPLLLAVAVGLWSAALLAAPALATQSQSTVGSASSAILYVVGSLICHQRPERSFHYEGAQLPVCARCTGLYVGGFLGTLGWVAIARSGKRVSRGAATAVAVSSFRMPILVAALPTLITVATAWLGWWDPSNLTRAVFALPLGAAVGVVVAAVAAGDLR